METLESVAVGTGKAGSVIFVFLRFCFLFWLNSHRMRKRQQMGPVVVNGSIHTARKQHQRKKRFNLRVRRVACPVWIRPFSFFCFCFLVFFVWKEGSSPCHSPCSRDFRCSHRWPPWLNFSIGFLRGPDAEKHPCFFIFACVYVCVCECELPHFQLLSEGRRRKARCFLAFQHSVFKHVGWLPRRLAVERQGIFSSSINWPNFCQHSKIFNHQVLKKANSLLAFTQFLWPLNVLALVSGVLLTFACRMKWLASR